VTDLASGRDAKFCDLLDRLRAMGQALVAFSGGLDSTFLLRAARQAMGDGVLAVTLVTPYVPASEIREARDTATAMGARHELLEIPFPEAIRTNPPDRCYLCKRILFGRLVETARSEGLVHVLDGTNLDDLSDYRPGLRALGELGIESPLLVAGLTKRDIRELSRGLGLAWDKPAMACLLSRLPHGTRVEEADLRRIEQAEDFLKSLGFAAVRGRGHGNLARIEVPRERVAEVVAADRRHGIETKLLALGFRHVTVDLGGYRMGSCNEPKDNRA
jgi:uncharacterized protein